MRILIEGKKTLYGVINEKTLSKEQLNENAGYYVLGSIMENL